MTTKKTVTFSSNDNFFGLLKGDVTEARKNLKKWRKDFSKDAEKRHKKIRNFIKHPQF